MKQSVPFGVPGENGLQVLWEDSDLVLCRGDGGRGTVLLMLPAAESPPPAALDRLAHEYELRGELDAEWAALPVALSDEGGRTRLLIEDAGGEPLERILGAPLEPGRFLRLAIGVAAALSGVHRRGLVHKDIKPANILTNCADGRTRLTGFGIASRLPRERPAPEPPEVVAGTLAYMAPEQTGRMNRSIDSRSDLYALGVTFYRMLTGRLPFSAADPMEWVHCHVARKPVSPAERLPSVPLVLSEIVMKLLAKTPEERYQTAAGVEHDLRRALAEWELRGLIEPFALGQGDRRDRLSIPEKLYGREREVETLLAAFDRIAGGRAPELVLVSGRSGIGKSSVVNELHKALVPPRGLFASGKFDRLKRDIPYSTLVQAFRSLARLLLSKSDDELLRWREALLEALGPTGRLMTDLIPELGPIIGEQPAVPELEPQQAQRRFQVVFRRLVGVFARPEHPLALFLDDLQWLDAATLDLLQDLSTQADVRHLLLVGAYRDNEVDARHPLARKLAAIRSSGAKVSEIKLGPLDPEQVGRLIGDGLGCETAGVLALAQLVHRKTAGNPFFVLQFLSSLADDRLLTFDPEAQSWSWDLDRIRAKSEAGNVVALMVGKLDRLPDDARKALQQLACLGNIASVETLAIVLGASEHEVHAALWEAVRIGLVERHQRAYKFSHDRVQEAAYSLIPEEQRAAAHLRIGRFLVARTPAERREEAIFEIVNQLNRGVELIASQHEREHLAELNLIAGRRAKAETAYASALTYLATGAALATEDGRMRRRTLIFELELHRAECEFLTGATAEAESRLAELSQRAADALEGAAVVGLRIDLCKILDRTDSAIAVGLEYLRRHLGVDWSPSPTDGDVQREYGLIWSRLGSRTIEQLIDLPLTAKPASAATLDVLMSLAVVVWHTNANLACMAISRAVNLSLERGNCDSSCYHYVSLGYIAGPRFGDYAAGYRFGRLGYELVEKRGLKRFQARIYKDFGAFVIPWTKHVRTGRDILRGALEVASQSGDLTFAAYSHVSLNSNLLAAGDPLIEVERQVEIGLAFARKLQFHFVIDLVSAHRALVRTLRGQTRKFGSFDDGEFDELEVERRFSDNPDLVLRENCYWVRKLQARFFAGDYDAAVYASTKALQLPWASVAHFEETPEHHFYGALSRAACGGSGAADQRLQHQEALAAHYRQLQICADNCPENFENRAALVGAEIARLEGREIDAERLYEQAIRSARANGFVHHEALAYELAANFYAARGFEDFSHVYLHKAHDGYLRWGADGKARQLEQLHPYLRREKQASASAATIGAPVEALDLATVIKMSQAVSAEIVLEKLIDALMRTAIEQAGAERGLLILLRGGEPQIEAEASTVSDTVVVNLREGVVTEDMAPESVLHYVLSAQESVILDDATESAFVEDPYICERQARSILCLPLINQGRLNGALYLENNLAPRVFAPARIAVLKLLASQAAIALENTHLYQDLAEREAKIRRLVDANIIGIFVCDFEGRIFEANDAFLRIVGYDREDLLAGRLRWTDLTPSDWRERDAQWIDEHRRTGLRSPIEKEYFRKDGSRVPILLGSATIAEGGNKAVTFVVDLSERKRAEAALRDSEEQWKAVFENNPTMYFMVDSNLTILSVNPFGAGQLGYAPEELVGRPVQTLVPEADMDEAQRNKADCLKHLGRTASWESRKIRKDGSVIWVRETGRAILIKNQPVVLIASEDVTEAKRAAESLRQAQAQLAHANRLEAMGQLTASIAHEVNQPIAAMLANAQAGLRWLGFAPPDLDEVRHTFDRIVRDGTRAGKVVQRIRNLIKKSRAREELVEINTAVGEVVELTLGEATKNSVAVRAELGEGLPPILGDRVELQQVVLNLILNAVEAMAGSSEGERQLLIATSKTEAGDVLVAVRDTGPGLAPATRENLFNAFYTTKPNGLGLGLSICRSIVESHGGQLQADANTPRGAVFQFTLPSRLGEALLG